jgi:hypothetical protein
MPENKMPRNYLSMAQHDANSGMLTGCRRLAEDRNEFIRGNKQALAGWRSFYNKQRMHA